MRKSGRKILKKIQQRNLSEEINCINAMQRTPYRVNDDVLQALETVWQNNIQINGLVQREQIELEPYPFEVEPSHLSVEELLDLDFQQSILSDSADQYLIP